MRVGAVHAWMTDGEVVKKDLPPKVAPDGKLNGLFACTSFERDFKLNLRTGL